MATKSLKSKTTRSLQTLVEHKEKRGSTVRSSESRRKPSYSDKPTPLDFDTFIPWVCMEWQVPEVITIIRVAQEKFSRSERRVSSAKTKSVRSVKLKEEDDSTAKRASATTTGVTSSTFDNIVPIKAFYDSHSHLAEIAIESCVSALHRKVIQAISLCIPFHSFLTKLVIRKGGLDFILLHEISKLLPHSNLTDVCLDDTKVPEGNYYVLLDHASNLKRLSLNRCTINDDVCKEIASRIDFGHSGEKSLAILELGSNLITDVGAKYLGNVLRKNRHLLHLNLLGNKIGDKGLEYLIEHLQEFPLTYDEILDKRLRTFQYYQRKSEIYEHCLEEISRLKKTESESSPSDKRSSFTNKQAKFKKLKKSLHHVLEPEQPSNMDLAEKMTNEILGEFKDPFDDYNCIWKDDYCYATGNLKFCSLNVAFNNLEFISLLKILKVLRYQCMAHKSHADTGLMRIVLEGNYFPNSCPELENIDMYLKKAVYAQIPLHMPNSPSMKRRTSFHGGKHR